MHLTGRRGLQTYLLRSAGFSVRRFRRAGPQPIGEQRGGRFEPVRASAGGIDDRCQRRRPDSRKANVIKETAVFVERKNVLVKSGNKDFPVAVAIDIQYQGRRASLGAEQMSPDVATFNINGVEIAPQTGAKNQR